MHTSLKLLVFVIIFCFFLHVNVMAQQLHFQAHVFSSKAGRCAAFLSNFHWDKSARVKFNNMHYELPSWSISILPDCKNVIFNTAMVSCFDHAWFWQIMFCCLEEIHT